jgi:hypothetical protein
MRPARSLITMCCALAIATMLMVTGARADTYNKLTYLTFSGPVQVPGVTLPAGTYMFKLADPESGRRAIQIWDEKGTKLFTTLLTIPDEQPEAKDDPVVLFSERPSGSAAAVKSWFYPAERTGYEFIYPKSQAMKIAADSKTSVMAYNDELKSDADEAAMRNAQVGRIDAQGQAAADSDTATATTTTATTAPSNTAQASTAPTSTASREQQPAASAAPARPADEPSANRTASGTAAASSTTTTTTASNAAGASAAPSAGASTTAPRSTTAVGTSGQSDRPAQSAQNAQRADALPRTASPLATLQLLSIGLIASGLGVRHLRRRYAPTR